VMARLPATRCDMLSQCPSCMSRAGSSHIRTPYLVRAVGMLQIKQTSCNAVSQVAA